MKLDSPFFDRIRVKPDADRSASDNLPRCASPGCAAPAPHRAPKGRGREGEFFHFCLDHVRDYNRSYNYFSGMSDDDIARYQESTIIGHRPTWAMGVNSAARGRAGEQACATDQTDFGMAGRFSDPFGFFAHGAGQARAQQEAPRRTLRNMERKSLEALNLDDIASPQEIKARYKQLVKRHHPDANGGDRGSEDRLREIIQAYTYLKNAGFC